MNHFTNMGKPDNQLPNVPKHENGFYPYKIKDFNTQSVNKYPKF